jgi:hypothetical protein
MNELIWRAEAFDKMEWDLLNELTGSSPCLDGFNVELLMKHFGTRREMPMVCRRGSSVLAMTVLSPGIMPSTFHPSNQPLGLWLQRPEVDFTELVRSLARRYLMLSVMHLDPDRDVRPPPQEPLIETVDYIETARITIESSFEDYWSARRSLKANLKNRRNRLEKAGIKTRLEVVRDPAAIAAAIADYGRIESAGWKSTEGSAVSPDNAQGRYYRELFEALAQRGSGSVWRYFYGEKLVATDLCANRTGVFIVLKTTYDESEKATSPSHLMRQEMFQQLFSDGETKVIEFYGRAMGWHREWTNEIRGMYHVNAFRAPWMQALRAVLRKHRRGAAVT